MGAGGARTKALELAKQTEARTRPHAGGQDKDVFDMSGSELDGLASHVSLGQRSGRWKSREVGGQIRK